MKPEIHVCKIYVSTTSHQHTSDNFLNRGFWTFHQFSFKKIIQEVFLNQHNRGNNGNATRHTIHQNSAFEALRGYLQKVVFYMLYKERRTLFLQRRRNEPSKKLILKDEQIHCSKLNNLNTWMICNKRRGNQTQLIDIDFLSNYVTTHVIWRVCLPIFQGNWIYWTTA